MRDYFVYMLRCSDGSYYVGVTNDYQKRFAEHQAAKDPKSYTSRRRPVELVYLATFGAIIDAIHWEKQIKRWSRKKKEALITDERYKLHHLAECKNETHFKHKKLPHMSG